jgi:nitroreductase
MDFKKVIKKRKSVRHFQDIDVPNKDIKEIIKLARKCPSAGAIRRYETIITKKKIVNVNAPVYLVICANPEAYTRKYGERGRDLYSVQDATIFASYIQLAIVNAGLSSVWIGAFRESKIKKILQIGEHLRPVAIIPLGYPVREKSGKRTK